MAWTLVHWHNKHPLARRITIQDVHTVGAVALPFLAQALPKEPSLDAASASGSPAAAPVPPKRRFPWQRRSAAAGPRRAWSDVFIPGLKPDAVAQLALDNGFTAAPDELPLRRVDIDNAVLNESAGAWPMELVLLSAAFDAGPARRRVLVGRRDQVLGQRSLDPKRLAIVGVVVLLVLIGVVWGLWPAKKGTAGVEGPGAAASAASAAGAANAASAVEGASARMGSPASASSLGASAASDVRGDAAVSPEGGASAAIGAGQGATEEKDSRGVGGAAVAASAPASGAVPDIRPVLVPGSERSRPPLGSGAPLPQGGASAAGPGAAGTTGAAGRGSADPTSSNPSQRGAATTSEPSKPGEPSTSNSATADADRRLPVGDAGVVGLMRQSTAPAGKVVALVALPQKTRPEAEAQLVRMREMISQTLGGNAAPQGEVFQTKEGWRAAVWPFNSREEAQLINATLLARGLRARAVDF